MSNPKAFPDFIRLQMVKQGLPDSMKEDVYMQSTGMDLRDYFAARAMQLFLNEGSFNSPEAAAKTAYEYADAMMKARETNG